MVLLDAPVFAVACLVTATHHGYVLLLRLVCLVEHFISIVFISFLGHIEVPFLVSEVRIEQVGRLERVADN